MCSSYFLETKGGLKSDLKTFLYISAFYAWKIASSFSDPWFIFCWQSPETLNHHVAAKMLDLVHNLTLGLMTLFAYLSWYASLKLSAASLTRTIYEAIFHKNNIKNLHGHIYEDSSEITSIFLRDFESFIADPDCLSESFGGSLQKTDKNISQKYWGTKWGVLLGSVTWPFRLPILFLTNRNS